MSGHELEPLADPFTSVCLALVAGLPLLAAAVRVRVRIRRPCIPGATPRLCRGLSLLGLSLVLTTPAAAEQRREAPAGRSRSAAPPWSSTGGSPPPRPPVDAQAHPWDAPATTHPAIHGRGPVDRPLFPRVARSVERRDGSERRSVPCVEKAACMARHPAGKGSAVRKPELQSLEENGSRRRSTHVVKPGDTLWDIASEVLDTDDQRRIARYWPRIHRANRTLIGRDPNLIYPGQVLELPDPSDA
jgi:nucleoid-associated protein YgaU